jgi:hypothetical protein
VSVGGVVLVERTLETSCTDPAPRLDAHIVVTCTGYSGLATATVVLVDAGETLDVDMPLPPGGGRS